MIDPKPTEEERAATVVGPPCSNCRTLLAPDPSTTWVRLRDRDYPA
jgi:hypothetical protein